MNESMHYITDIDVFALNLPISQNFSISGGLVGNKHEGSPHVYVKISTTDGTEGWGEARPSHRWSYETIESVVTTIKTYFVKSLKGVSIFNLDEIHKIMDQQISSGLTRGQPIAKAAIDMAAMDIIGKIHKQPLTNTWLSKHETTIDLSYLISVSSTEAAAEKAYLAKAQGYSGLDVKIGIDPLKDIKILQTIKDIAPDLYFRVDANQAYHLKESMYLSKAMEEIRVNVFEQPLVAGDLIGHAKLREFTTIPIALDESVWTPTDVAHAIQMQACDAIVIKATKMGGISQAKRCGEIAKAAGLDLLGGGLTESSLGLYASAHLFHALDITTPVDLNGPLFLEDDPSKIKAIVKDGKVSLPDGYGIGWEVDEQKLTEYLIEI